ncbi:MULTISPECIES: succinylglutamate desuccinylase/aspartoacylase family protein [Tatumella]|uniref:Succinylglutamate desuccinylase/aspartoacylase family protein n=1 Tax=Tatumella punctata TaxID=399969 RepID=A0ABW1VKW5_9GAMM|nr:MULTISPECIES: succinylglutamate desuccinylase/aspartoacylase family protein [unclassified Tatumella]MBS0876173.1 succinylglutamate desuccinylase/aspartoacylase family protein [Tatumella sp. JGM82]MBS0889221.1 succinylglutamate desuccinylase/aspartoacylase family protein [Tatumella sp. JGM94]MBS0901103.1 succinylglutamate desuccinylase/aspartoacylase family protein [Tatumella sp. JGM100]
MYSEFIDLPSPAPGMTLQLTKYTFGDVCAGRTAYFQAGLHADEHPGLLVLQHLKQLLVQCEREGRLSGGVVIIPVANPVGLMQNVSGHVTGRYHLANGENFNRNFADLQAVLTRDGAQTLNSNARQDCRAYITRLLGDVRPADTVSAIKHSLLSEALQHDVVIDLHCDQSAILHLYTNRCHHLRAVNLAASLGAEVIIEEQLAGGQPFDESVLRCWQWFAEHKGLAAEDIPFTVTVELRGQADVSDLLAARDAEALLRFLETEGIVAARQTEAPDCSQVVCYPLEGVSYLQAPAEGIISWQRQPGDKVVAGDLLAEVVILSGAEENNRLPVLSPQDGRLVTRPLISYVRQGQNIGMLAGYQPHNDRRGGTLLSD